MSVVEPLVTGLVAVGIFVVQRHVRVGDCRLPEILIHAAAAADEPPFELDRHPRAALDFLRLLAIGRSIVSLPVDAVLFQPLVKILAPIDIHSSPLPLMISGMFRLVSICSSK